MPVNASTTISDGTLAIANRSSTPLRLVKIEPVFENNQSSEDGIEVVGIKIAELPGNDDFLSIQRQFPPSQKVEAAWKDVAGQYIQPLSDVSAYVVFFGLKSTSGIHHLSAARVTFDANGSQYTADFKRDTILCEAKSSTQNHC